MRISTMRIEKALPRLLTEHLARLAPGQRLQPHAPKADGALVVRREQRSRGMVQQLGSRAFAIVAGGLANRFVLLRCDGSE